MAQELKSVYIDRTGDWCRSGNNTGNFYLKSEVDAVLAAKDKEIERLDDLAHAHNIELLRKENLIAEKDAEIRRLKELKDKYSSCAEKAINGIAKCELKTYDFPVDHGDFTSTVELFYLKSEADKVISHHKYKRCLAMAKWCESECRHYEDLNNRKVLVDHVRWSLLKDWHKRWLELAEKFKDKEAK